MQVLWWLNTLQIPSAFILLVASYIHFWLDRTAARFDPAPADVYDFIVVGAGSAGSVVASRLTESGKYSVLLLEAGGYPSHISSIPLMSAILGSTPLNWDYRTVPQTRGCGSSREQRSYWPRGKALGGSSILNFMLYVRGNRLDFDNWAQMGNPGWSYDHVLPYFMKSESNRGTRIDAAFHGFSGPLTVEDRAWQSNLPQAFIEAGQELGFQPVDVNGANQIGFTTPQVTTRNGQRGSTYLSYLQEAQRSDRLKIVTHALVQRVLVDSSMKAYGVHYVSNDRSYTVRARKEIILSAGTIGTPQILMLSGIGPKEHLNALGIPVLVNSAVGHNLQDHVFVPYAPLIHNDTAATLVHPLDLKAWWDYFVHGTGQYTSNGIDGMAFISTNYTLHPQWPDIQLHFAGYSFATDSGVSIKETFGLDYDMWDRLFKPVVNENTASILVTLMRPLSRGQIRLKSTDPADHPFIDPRYYSHPRDAEVMMEGLKFARNVVRTSAMKKHKMFLSEIGHPSCLQYELDSDPYLRCLMEQMSMTLYHPVGTCKMGPRNDTEAVVDPRLRVYGVRGLRVADASVMPQITTGNTNAPVIMIGEKMADLLLKEWDQSDDLDQSSCLASDKTCSSPHCAFPWSCNEDLPGWAKPFISN